MIGCFRTRLRKQPIIALYFESETVLKFYNLEASPLSSQAGSFQTRNDTKHHTTKQGPNTKLPQRMKATINNE